MIASNQSTRQQKMKIVLDGCKYTVTTEKYVSGEDYIRVDDCNGYFVGSATVSHNYESVDIVQQVSQDNFFETTFPYGEYESPKQIGEWIVATNH